MVIKNIWLYTFTGIWMNLDRNKNNKSKLPLNLSF